MLAQKNSCNDLLYFTNLYAFERFCIFNVAHRGRKYGTTTMIGMGHTKNLQLQSNRHNGTKDNERNKKKIQSSR